MTLNKARIVFLCLPASGSSSTGKHSELQSQLRRPTKKSTQLWRSRSTGHPTSHLTNAETRGDTPLTVRHNALTSHNNGSMNYEITQVIVGILNTASNKTHNIFTVNQVAVNVLRIHHHSRAVLQTIALEWWAQLCHVHLDEEQQYGQHRTSPCV